jgi:regulatory protein
VKPETTLTPDEILAKLEYFCAYQERCPQEVRRKLTELGAHGEVAEQIYSVLENDAFFDEARFAEAYTGGKFRVNQWGRVRIRLELRRRDIAPDIIRQALDSIGEEEYLIVLQNLIAKKREKWPAPNDYAAKAKTAAALIRVGYEPELVFRYL